MIFLVLVSIPKLLKYLPPFHKSLVWDKTLLLVHDRNWIPPLLPQGVVFYYNFLMYNYVVLLFQLFLVRVFLTPVKLSSSLSITSKDIIPLSWYNTEIRNMQYTDVIRVDPPLAGGVVMISTYPMTPETTKNPTPNAVARTRHPQDTQMVTVVFLQGSLISPQRTSKYSMKQVIKKNTYFRG